MTVKNVAAVFITASLPPFARPGAKLDVTVSSVGDAKSLVGGVLLMSALHGPDGQVYAEAQGPLEMGGYMAGNSTNGKEVNSTTVGTIPNGGMVERDTAVDLHDFKTVSLLLRNPDFTTAKSIADAVNAEFHKVVASALDSTRVDVNVADAASPSVPLLISRVQNLALMVYTPAKIVINERTGTIVLGGDVKITPVSVIHGNLSIEVTTSYTVAPIPARDLDSPIAPAKWVAVAVEDRIRRAMAGRRRIRTRIKTRMVAADTIARFSRHRQRPLFRKPRSA